MDEKTVGTDPFRASLEQALGSQYRLLRLLGRGGMGAVYLAREEALERLVAIKVLRPEAEANADDRERFRREARTAAQLNHPNIVPLHAFGEVDGLLYLVLGYVRGEPLSARLRRDERLSVAEARRVLGDVAEALDYAHRKGVVHRDVKPDNILIEDETGRAVLADFGIAKSWTGGETVTRAGRIVGTPLYMSPEQAAGDESLDGRSDLYSLGVAAWAMLAGRLPFVGGTAQEALVERLTQDGPPLGPVAPAVPESLDAAITRCLRRDREERWPDARAFREAAAPTNLEEDQLPEPLDTLDGAIPFLLPFALLFVLALLVSVGSDRPDALRALMVVLSGGFVASQLPILWSAGRLARRRGFTPRQIAASLFRQPEWWFLLWYPRRFRRAGDVFDRLPLPFRVWRISCTVAVGAVTVVASFFSLGAASESPFLTPVFERPEVHEKFVPFATGVLGLSVVAFLGSILGLGGSAAFAARTMRRRGLDRYTLRRVARTLSAGPTSNRVPWKRADVAAFLLPLAPGAQEPETPSEIVQALADAARALTGERREAASEGLAVARRWAADLRVRDASLGRLAADADSDEAARLKGRLEAMGEAGDDEDQERMRGLLREELAIVERRLQRRDSALRERDRMAERLKALWRAVEAVRTAERDGHSQAVSRLRALCGEDAPVEEPGATTLEDSPTNTR